MYNLTYMIEYQNLFKPTILRELCKTYSLTPSKKYGQNYLISKSPIDKMIEAGDLQKNDTVVEIGPGFGVLTFALSERVQKVFSFEIEKKLQEYWKENAPENVEIVWGNALFEMQSAEFGMQNGYKVLANLPYQITSNILRVLLETKHKPERIIVMVQKEVAQRITAKKGDMSLLAVSVQYYGVPKMIAKVTAGNFFPAPKVDSAVLGIYDIGKVDHGVDDAKFFQIVSAGFANKRKQLWRNLSDGLKIDRETVKKILKEVTGNEMIRAQELGVGEWVRIVRKLG